VLCQSSSVASVTSAQQQALFTGGVDHNPGGHRRQQRGNPACRHHEADIIRPPVPLRQKDAQKRPQPIAHIRQKKAHQAERL